MSELQKAWARTKLRPLPTAMVAARDLVVEQDEQQLPLGEVQEAAHPVRAHPQAVPHATAPPGATVDPFLDVDALPELPEPHDDDDSSASSASSTGTVVPSASRQLFARPQGRPLDPIPWTVYFEQQVHISAADGSDRTLHAYLTAPASPSAPLFVMHHGAGSSGLSFAVLGAEIRKLLPDAGILALDARGHGATPATTPSHPALDLSLDALAADLVALLRGVRAHMFWDALPPIVLVGHSLGGAVVTHLAASLARAPDAPSAVALAHDTLAASLLGYVVLDVVEGSAMDALQSMLTYLSSRPSGFASVQAGVEWHVRSRTIRNTVSARTSVPGLLEMDAARDAARPWRWKTDLAGTQPFWEGWFVGLSKKFLAGRGGKMLLLAGTDRLDTELTIGQMQGKYALQVFPEAGHFIHEDMPEKTAVALVDFFRRNDRSSLVLPPKVSDLLKQGKRV